MKYGFTDMRNNYTHVFDDEETASVSRHKLLEYGYNLSPIVELDNGYRKEYLLNSSIVKNILKDVGRHISEGDDNYNIYDELNDDIILALQEDVQDVIRKWIIDRAIGESG